MKYLRRKTDGHVFNFSEPLAVNVDMEEFLTALPPPEVIPNLSDYMEAEKKARAVKVTKTKTEE